MSNAIVKNLNFGDEARLKIQNGVDKLTKAVSSTLGAGGKSVIMEDHTGKPIITKDGVTVAESVILRDPVENMGATLLKEAARKTVREAGDGTTTATVLANEILSVANEALTGSTTSRDIVNGIDSGLEKVLKYLDKNSKKLNDKMLEHVASVSVNNDDFLGKVIADAFRSVDLRGVVMMETSEDGKTSFDLVEGVQYDKGTKNPNFVTNAETKTIELHKPYVLLVESPIDNFRQIQSVMEYCVKKNKPILIIGDVDNTVVNTLALNKKKNGLKVNVIDAPTYGVNRKEVFEDLAMVTGATLVNEDLGDDLDLIRPEFLGRCVKSVTYDFETKIIIDGENDESKALVEVLKDKLSKAKSPQDIVKIEKRLARVSGKIAVVKVGANSEVELKEKLDRVEDAICATKAAIKEGIVPGGGIALLNASTHIKSKGLGEEVLLKAIKAPYFKILENAGITPLEPQDKGVGLNAVTGEPVNMVKHGIIDPLMVTKSALRNAASVAKTILSTNCVINNLRIDEGNR
jgi:chaperonin GroEL